MPTHTVLICGFLPGEACVPLTNQCVCIVCVCVGVFSWITINYLLGHFSPESHSQSVEGGPPHTVGVMDMGGASLQIAFEVTQVIIIVTATTQFYIMSGDGLFV